MEARSEARGGVLLGLGAILFWGASFVATKLALAELSPMAVVLGRSAVGGVFLLAVMLSQRRLPRVPRSCWRSVVIAGFLGVTLHQGVQAHALTVTTAARTGWLVAAVPLWSAILAWVFLRERLGRLRAVGRCAGDPVALVGAAGRGAVGREAERA